MKALHASGTPAAWDEDGILQTFTLVGNIAGQTNFRGVKYLQDVQTLVNRIH